jgi:CheY-like chemotaxis protein
LSVFFLGFFLFSRQMPEMDGLEAARLICAWKAEKNLVAPVLIALTANVHESSRIACAEAGMPNILAKPIKLELLQQCINSSISK